MQKYNKFLRNIIELVETGLISSKDLKKELENFFKFKAESMINNLNLVSRDEFEVQKEIIAKMRKEIFQIRSKKRKRSTKSNKNLNFKK